LRLLSPILLGLLRLASGMLVHDIGGDMRKAK